MKKILLIMVPCLLFFPGNTFSQKVGVGTTTTPAFKLDVKGGSINTDSVYRIGGITVLSVKGISNAFIGSNAGFNSTGAGNTAIGSNAFVNNTTGLDNSALGASALFSNTVGNYNTAVGRQAMYFTTAGSNSALGAWSLYFNTSGYGNTALGEHSMYDNTTGSFNVASGTSSLTSNISGSYNVASGHYSLLGNISGTGNIGLGYNTMNLTSASSYNVALGYNAGSGYDLGWNNTFLGAESGAAGAGLYNCIAIGNAAKTFANNQARIGNSSTLSIGGYASWTVISDGRFKKNIKEDVKGLAFIMKLKPVTYQLDVFSLSKKLNERANNMIEPDKQAALLEKEKIVQSGFIAQEVETAANELGYDFSGVDKPKNENDLYGLRYAEFVVPLVKAVQELKQQLEELKAEIDRLKSLNQIPK